MATGLERDGERKGIVTTFEGAKAVFEQAVGKMLAKKAELQDIKALMIAHPENYNADDLASLQGVIDIYQTEKAKL